MKIFVALQWSQCLAQEKNNAMEKIIMLFEYISSHTNQLVDQPQPT